VEPEDIAEALRFAADSTNRHIPLQDKHFGTDDLLMHKFEESYSLGLKMREAIESRVSNRLGILGIILAGFAYVSGHVSWDVFGLLNVIMLGLYLLSFVFIAITVYYLFRTIHALEYKYLPESTEINDYFTQLKDFYGGFMTDPAAIQTSLQKDYLLFFSTTYMRMSDFNAENNARKSGALDRSTRHLFFASILIFLMLIVLFTMKP